MKLEYFDEFVMLSKYLNFSTTAEVMHITQPVLSRHIAMLEEELGCSLFNRSTQSVRLTDEGTLALERLEKILGEYADLKSELRLRRQGFDSSVCIGFPYYAMESYLGNLPERYESMYPKVKIKYEVGDPHQMLELLRQDRIDIAIIPQLSYPHIEKYTSYPLFEEHLGILISRDHPLAKQKECSIADLRDMLFFSIDNNYFASTWEQTKDICRNSGFTPRGPAMFSVMEAALIAARRGDGVIVVGEHMKIHESNELSYLRLTGEGCSRIVSMWTAKDNVSPSARKFVRLAIEDRKKQL